MHAEARAEAEERAERAEASLAEQEEWGERWRTECEALRGELTELIYRNKMRSSGAALREAAAERR